MPCGELNKIFTLITVNFVILETGNPEILLLKCSFQHRILLRQNYFSGNSKNLPWANLNKHVKFTGRPLREAACELHSHLRYWSSFNSWIHSPQAADNFNFCKNHHESFIFKSICYSGKLNRNSLTSN